MGRLKLYVLCLLKSLPTTFPALQPFHIAFGRIYDFIRVCMFFNGWDGFGSFIRLLDYTVLALSSPTEGQRSSSTFVYYIIIIIVGCTG